MAANTVAKMAVNMAGPSNYIKFGNMQVSIVFFGSRLGFSGVRISMEILQSPTEKQTKK
jgi:hypothetical protein